LLLWKALLRQGAALSGVSDTVLMLQQASPGIIPLYHHHFCHGFILPPLIKGCQAVFCAAASVVHNAA
jgi:hypothetical protein